MSQQQSFKKPSAKVLLATFVSEEKYLVPSITRVFSIFTIEYDQVFVFAEIDNIAKQQKKIITYNVLCNDKRDVDTSNIFNTIRINRRQDSNTLFTINGLNAIIKEEIGKVDPTHVIKWEEYSDMLIHYDEKKKRLILTPIVLISITDKEFFTKNNKIKLLQENDSQTSFGFTASR